MTCDVVGRGLTRWRRGVTFAISPEMAIYVTLITIHEYVEIVGALHSVPHLVAQIRMHK